MKAKIPAVLLFFSLIFNLVYFPVSATTMPKVTASSYMVINAETGYALLSKNENTSVQSAEELVVFALLTALEHGDLNQEITVPADLPTPNNSLQLKSGDRFFLKDLIEMTALNSSSQSLHCIAIGVFGSTDAMIESMQKTAQKLNCKNTTFSNLDFDDPQNQTTAYDLALAGKSYMEQETLSALFKTVCKEFVPIGKDASASFLVYSTNALVSNYRYSSYLYQKSNGMKEATLSSKQSHHLLTSSKSGNKNIIIALMDVPEKDGTISSYTESKEISEYIFENYGTTTLLKKDAPIREYEIENAAKGTHIILKASQAQTALLPLDLKEDEVEEKITCQENMKAPIKKNEIFGEISFYFRGNFIGSSTLYSDRSVDFSPFVSVAGYAVQIVGHPVTITLLVLLVLAFAVLFLRLLYLEKQKKNKRKRNRRK